MKTIRWFAASAIALAVPLAAQTANIDPEKLRQHVITLGSDAFEGRAPATAGETKTVAYLSDQFAKAGLQPGGESSLRRAHSRMIRCGTTQPARTTCALR